nr:hypothetical protein [Rhodoferax sp.]
MPLSLTEALGRFNDPHDEGQLRLLDEAVSAVDSKACGEREFRALLGVFERFPEDDGYEVFWSIVHCLEACTGYEQTLIESVTRCPVEFNVLMINRLLNGGVGQINNQPLLSVLVSVSSNPAATAEVKKSAQRFVEYQEKRGCADAQSASRWLRRRIAATGQLLRWATDRYWSSG